MKELTLLRHAKSSWDNPGLADHERPLNKRGKRDAPAMGARIREAAIRPSLIISSPAVRAWNTAKIVAREISYPLEFLQRERDLYHAGLQTLIEVAARQDVGFNSLMMVGHNPGLTQFANFLVPGLTSNVPTCGVVTVSLDIENWDVNAASSIKLIAYDYPKKKR